ncbi:protein of unknown function [Candidatus Hydrogenisulfobacillus filiaventi]|uniref:IPT/TIG domain-containing protein n=1 Tax=Candidatus Hydrogenisulfobacillus filiaventi TaxID=2707344 RepID=A0A6F8ZIH7_9FIRM|nr:protein of unknown function [Candidatus Hydrogenisulfobacillus filiaventi]
MWFFSSCRRAGGSALKGSIRHDRLRLAWRPARLLAVLTGLETAGCGPSAPASDHARTTAVPRHRPPTHTAVPSWPATPPPPPDPGRVRRLPPRLAVTARQPAAPMPASMTLVQGPVGTVVTLSGSGFGTVAGRVTFTPNNGGSAAGYPAVIRSWWPWLVWTRTNGRLTRLRSCPRRPCRRGGATLPCAMRMRRPRLKAIRSRPPRRKQCWRRA